MNWKKSFKNCYNSIIEIKFMEIQYNYSKMNIKY